MHSSVEVSGNFELRMRDTNKKKGINITVGKYSGFCFGVRRAYDLTCVNSKNCDDVYILGKLVHNNDVCKDLYKRGIKGNKSPCPISKRER